MTNTKWKQKRCWNFGLNNLKYNKYTLVEMENMIYFVPSTPITLGWAITILQQWLFEDEIWNDTQPSTIPKGGITITEDYIYQK